MYIIIDEPSVFSLDCHPNPNKIYEIEPLCSPNKLITVEDAKSKEGTNIYIYEKTNSLNQKFKINLIDNENCNLEACHAKDKVFDVAYSKVKNHTNIHLWTKNNTNAQSFRIIKTGDDCYSFLSNLNVNYCIDISFSGTKNKTNVQLYERNNTNAQKFKLIGKNVLKSAVEYALKYADEKNEEYNYYEGHNGANFCSQCLYAGGEDPNDDWNKKTDAFKNDELLRTYFMQKGIPWSENVKIKEINVGDIVFTKSGNNSFSEPIFVIKKLKKGLIYCGNNPNVENKGILKCSVVPGVLHTRKLFE